MPLAIHAVSRPLYQKELVTRDKINKPSKSNLKGHQKRSKLSQDEDTKHAHCVCDYTSPCSQPGKRLSRASLSKDEKKFKNLETLKERLNQTSSIISLARHFLTRIMYIKSRMNAFARYRLHPDIFNNLKLHMRILQNDKLGVFHLVRSSLVK